MKFEQLKVFDHLKISSNDFENKDKILFASGSSLSSDGTTDFYCNNSNNVGNKKTDAR